MCASNIGLAQDLKFQAIGGGGALAARCVTKCASDCTRQTAPHSSRAATGFRGEMGRAASSSLTQGRNMDRRVDSLQGVCRERLFDDIHR